MSGRAAAWVLAALAAGGPAPACDITRWPSAARLRPLLDAPGAVTVAIRYLAGSVPAAPVLTGLRPAAVIALDDDAVEVAEEDGAVVVRGARLPARLPDLDLAVRGALPDARRAEVLVTVEIGGGEPSARVREAVRGLPGVAGAQVGFAPGFVLLRFSGDRSPAPGLAHAVRRAVTEARSPSRRAGVAPDRGNLV